MKIKILSVAMAVVMVVCLVVCGTTYQQATGQTTSASEDFANGYFTVVVEWGSYKIVYANDTKVKYFIRQGGYHFGITPLYNADGTLQIYEGSGD